MAEAVKRAIIKLKRYNVKIYQMMFRGYIEEELMK